MTKILIVEDQELSLENLRLRLKADLPGAEVVTSRDITDVEGSLEAARISGYPFDVIVADVKVPVKILGNPEASPRLTRILEDAAKEGTCIVQMTAHWAENEVADNVIGRPILKMADADWPGRVVNAVAEQLIARHLRSLFPNTVSAVPYSRALGIRAQSLTYRLADAEKDIARYWHLLGPEVRARVKEHFDAPNSDNGIAAGGKDETID